MRISKRFSEKILMRLKKTFVYQRFHSMVLEWTEHATLILSPQKYLLEIYSGAWLYLGNF